MQQRRSCLPAATTALACAALSRRPTALAVARGVLLPAVLMLSVVWAFAGTLDACFTQDDWWFLEAIRRPWPDRAMLGGALVPDFVRPLSTYWWPLANQTLFGLEPWGFHLTQLAVLAATVHALYRALLAITGLALPAALGTALYGFCQVHPFTLGWISGSIDGLAACGYAHALWALTAFWRGTGPRWPVWLAFLLGLLAKEHAIALPAAAFLAGRLRRSGVQPDDVGHGDVRPGGGQELDVRDDLRLWCGFAVVAIAFAGFWLTMTRGAVPTTHGTFGFDLGRLVVVLRDSVVVANPWTPHDGDHSRAWAMLPLLLAGLVAAQRRRAAVPQLGFALALWLLPAAVFVFTKRPESMQRYYAHFSVFGLALLVALLAAGVRHRSLAAIVAVLGLVHTGAAVHLARTLVAQHRSPSLFLAGRSGAVQAQLERLLAEPGLREVWFLGVDGALWWAMGKGGQLRVMFPHLTATFDGHEAPLPADAVSTPQRLVLRAAAGDTFAIVR